ncbi:MAG: AI-2E family transporter [DPANN group archaeon]|nr:AI-2E family transporter [DPANN group archaeon]
MANNNIYKLLLVLAAVILAGMLLKPFLTPIVFAAVVVYLTMPLHKKISEKISETFSAYFMTALVIGIVVLLLSYGASIILNEFGRAYIFISKINSSQLSINPQLADTIKNAARFFFSRIISDFSGTVSQIPKFLLSVFIFFISLFYFFKDGEKFAKLVGENLPLPADKKDHLFNDMKKYVRAFVYVWLFIGLLQGVVAVIGFKLFGIPYAMLGGFAAVILSILPVVGTSALYIPIAAVTILNGDFNSGVGLLIYGLAIGGVLDNIIRPYLAGKHSDAHPLLILLGVLGGLILLGPSGFIIGPVILLGAVTILKSVDLTVFK